MLAGRLAAAFAATALVGSSMPVVAAAAPAAADDYVVNRQSSTVSFTISARVLVNVHKDGRFDDFTGDVAYDPVNPHRTRVDVTVYTASVDMKNPEHEALLRSGDFFDAQRYPTMQFVSRSTNVQSDGTLAVTGDLTIRGVTKRLVVPLRVRPLNHAGDATVFETSFQIDRTEFGILGNAKQSGLKVSIGKSVDIHLAIAATRTR